MNIVEITKQISIITASEYYEDGFGDKVDIHNIPEIFQHDLRFEGYLKFLKAFGCGELDACFYLEEEPIECSKVFPKERSHLKNMYIFATDQSEHSFAFDTMNNCNVVEISADGEISEDTLGTFEQFITKQLAKLVDIVKWREDNL